MGFSATTSAFLGGMAADSYPRSTWHAGGARQTVPRGVVLGSGAYSAPCSSAAHTRYAERLKRDSSPKIACAKRDAATALASRVCSVVHANTRRSHGRVPGVTSGCSRQPVAGATTSATCGGSPAAQKAAAKLRDDAHRRVCSLYARRRRVPPWWNHLAAWLTVSIQVAAPPFFPPSSSSPRAPRSLSPRTGRRKVRTSVRREKQVRLAAQAPTFSGYVVNIRFVQEMQSSARAQQERILALELENQRLRYVSQCRVPPGSTHAFCAHRLAALGRADETRSVSL